MAQSTARQWWPTTTVGSFGGTDFRKIQDTDPSANNTATKADFGTDTSSGNIVFDPGTTRSTRESIPSAPAASSGFGWAFDRALVNRDDSANSTIFPAGTWEIRAEISASAAQSGTPNTLTVIIYKVDASNNKTEMFRTASSAFGCLVAATANTVQWTTSSQAEIICAVNETVAVEVWITSIGKAVTGQILTFRLTAGPTGDTDPPWIKLASPGMRTQTPKAVSAVMKGVATQKQTKVFAAGNFGGAVMKGVPTISRRVVGARSISARMAGIATVTKNKLFAAANFGSARLVGIATMRQTKVFDPANFGNTRMAGVATIHKHKTFDSTNFGSARMAGIATLVRAVVVSRVFSARMAGVATMIKLLGLSRTFTATMFGISIFTKQLVLARTLSARMAGVATIRKLKTFATTSFGSAVMVGIATIDRASTTMRTLSARMTGIATLTRQVTTSRTLTAVMKGVAQAFATFDFSQVPSGTQTIIRRFIQIFDD